MIFSISQQKSPSNKLHRMFVYSRNMGCVFAIVIVDMYVRSVSHYTDYSNELKLSR